ncbi:putative bifunctional diguanylate cyclase/phosphodiesterase [Gorillibacterium sp. sgz5001074]|uniref:putative bifunctional diguanylate cyclase/phosphodiesterase n=1 Tax=Gorillibacterium sp. sgz5001074 TaxID=3446695 RepID=UPI003F6654AF
MKQVNIYTSTLFTIGVVSLSSVLFTETNQMDWRVLITISAIAILFEFIPVKLPNGMDYSLSAIGNIYVLYNYGLAPSFFPLILCTLANFVAKSRFQINWFRFFVSLGMYACNTVVAFTVLRILDSSNIFVNIFVITLAADAVNLLLRNGIMRSVFNQPILSKPSFYSVLNFLIPVLVCALVVIQLTLIEIFSKWLWSLGIIGFFVLLLSYMTSAYHKQLLAVEEKSKRLNSLYDNNPDLIITLDSVGTILAANPVLSEVLDYDPSVLIGQPVFQLLDPRERDLASSEFPKLLNGSAYTKQFHVLHANGSVREFSVICVPTQVNKQVVGAYIIGKDVTIEKEASRMIQTMAYYDSITGLPNRVLMMDQMHNELRLAEKNNSTIGVLFIDFDHFKAVNDTFGHSMGDMLLIKVAQKLREKAPPPAVVARLGGDEFLILLPGGSESDCVALSKKLLQAFEDSILLGEQPVFITPSIGISLYPEHGISGEQLVSRADAAMYRVKSAGGSHYLMFSSDMQKEHEDNKLISMLLRNCIENQEIWLQYQPQVDIKTGSVIGAEALARWTNPILGHVSPARFIPIAEQNNLILSIGNWILKTACKQNRQWQLDGHPPIKMAVNISSIQLQQENFVGLVERILEETGLEPQWLELELTESVLIRNTARNLQILEDLRQLGVSIAVDDFGVGYSSLSYLNRFSLDYLKIDRSFVQNIGSNPSDEAIIRMIIGLAKDLKLQVVAEGIETEEQYQFVKAEQCDCIQGYYFSKPLRVDEWVEFTWSPRSHGQEV